MNIQNCLPNLSKWKYVTGIRTLLITYHIIFIFHSDFRICKSNLQIHVFNLTTIICQLCNNLSKSNYSYCAYSGKNHKKSSFGTMQYEAANRLLSTTKTVAHLIYLIKNGFCFFLNLQDVVKKYGEWIFIAATADIKSILSNKSDSLICWESQWQVWIRCD